MQFSISNCSHHNDEQEEKQAALWTDTHTLCHLTSLISSELWLHFNRKSFICSGNSLLASQAAEAENAKDANKHASFLHFLLNSIKPKYQSVPLYRKANRRKKHTEVLFTPQVFILSCGYDRLFVLCDWTHYLRAMQGRNFFLLEHLGGKNLEQYYGKSFTGPLKLIEVQSDSIERCVSGITGVDRSSECGWCIVLHILHILTVLW